MSAFLALRRAAVHAARQEREVNASLRRERRAAKPTRRYTLGRRLTRREYISVLLYALNDYDAACAVVWLEKHMRDGGEAVPQRGVLREHIVAVCNECNAAAVAAAAGN